MPIKNKLNQVRVQGRVFDHTLEVKTVKNEKSENFGKEFINGRLDIATDEAGVNVVQVFYTYVTPTTKSGATNATYAALNKIITDGKTWVKVGKDEAFKVNINSSMAINDWYRDEELISTKRIEGGFCSIVNKIDDNEEKRSEFKMDVVINSAKRIEADGEKVKEDYMILRVGAFDFRNTFLPCDLIIRLPGGMNYFEDKEPSNANPLYTQIWGNIVSKTEKVSRVTESAFGEVSVDSYDRNVREWLVTGAKKVEYDFGDEEVMTVNDLKEAISARDIKLAEIKKRSEEYQASKAAAATAPIAKADDGFDF